MKFLRREEVQQRVGYGRSSIYSMMNAGKFPKAIKIGPNRIVWEESVIEQWMKDRVSDDQANLS